MADAVYPYYISLLGQGLDSVLDPKHIPPFCSTIVLDLDLDCILVLELQFDQLDQLPQTQLTED